LAEAASGSIFSAAPSKAISNSPFLAVRTCRLIAFKFPWLFHHRHISSADASGNLRYTQFIKSVSRERETILTNSHNVPMYRPRVYQDLHHDARLHEKPPQSPYFQFPSQYVAVFAQWFSVHLVRAV
jgi:hypothetical protein